MALAARVQVRVTAESSGSASVVCWPDRRTELIASTNPDTGPIQAALDWFAITEPQRIEITSPVSGGSGLGGSSAMLVALVTALAAGLGERVAAAQAARTAFILERIQCGRPVGQQDHWAAAIGGALELVIDPAGVARTRSLPALQAAIDSLLEQGALMLLRTPITRSSAAPLNAQASILSGGRAFGGVTSLVDEFYSAFCAQNTPKIGALLDRHWQAKRAFNPSTSNLQLDRWYEQLREAGALGAKVIGAGAGGYLLVASPDTTQHNVGSTAAELGLQRWMVSCDEHGVRVESE
ncbi:GHMP family kinase ATP-binding protein [Rhodococcus sp. 06-235-1A]|uniref:GHMP family kinase ATP-binding protein n=1 Tax=Rhodococcus sp. 06-235-1A TaxID=2022508 RepID=UPI0015C5DF6B|nr:hypothetical protein [Rhodococcus sp. 06-235-1A]